MDCLASSDSRKAVIRMRTLTMALMAAVTVPLAAVPAHAEPIELSCQGREVYKIDPGPGTEFASSSVKHEEGYRCGTGDIKEVVGQNGPGPRDVACQGYLFRPDQPITETYGLEPGKGLMTVEYTKFDYSSTPDSITMLSRGTVTTGVGQGSQVERRSQLEGTQRRCDFPELVVSSKAKTTFKVGPNLFR